LVCVFTEDLFETLQVHTSIRDRQPLPQRGYRTHQDVERYISSRLEIGDCLAANTDPFSDPGLRTAPCLALCPNALTQFLRRESHLHNARLTEHLMEVMYQMFDIPSIVGDMAARPSKALAERNPARGASRLT
jgi:hypothetical protein